MNQKFEETFEALNNSLDKSGKTHLFIIIHSDTWVNYDYEFVRVYLDKRKLNKKKTHYHTNYVKDQYDLSSEQSEKLNELQTDLLVTSLACIGFPALISSEEKIRKFFVIHSKQ